MPSLLVIDDDRSVLRMVGEEFQESNVEVRTANNARDGLRQLEQKPADVVLLDIMLPGTSGLETFEKIRQIDPKLPVIFITAGGTSDTAIEAMKMGAHDYVLKPLDLPSLRVQVDQALETRRLMNVRVEMIDSGTEDAGSDHLVGRSQSMTNVYKDIGRVASQDVAVLILGESGTGKELIARAIYQHSARSKRSFLAVNCAALPDALLESELFGHEKGAFTGADRRRIGKFEQCHGGTIFLDEIGDMSPLVQGKVLRLLQQQEFERIGGNETIQTDVRIITATNRDLDQMVEEGKFRADLFFRLNGYTIRVPPLRNRGEDLSVLTELFLGRFAHQMGKVVQGISPQAMEILTSYSWPGNVRELQSILKKTLLQTMGPIVYPDALPEEVRGGTKAKSSSHSSPASSDGDSIPSNLDSFLDEHLRDDARDLYAETLALMERCLVTRVLRFTAGNQSKAAQILGITRGSLRNKIQSLGISIGQVVQLEDGSAEEPVGSP